MHQILSSIKCLGRQGLAIRGDETEADSNLHQLHKMKAEEDSNLAKWLKRQKNVYTSPDIQNEIIKLMGHQVLRDIAGDLQKSSFLTLMADETSNSSNHEQVTLTLRHVTKELRSMRNLRAYITLIPSMLQHSHPSYKMS